jgi:hypothetical protein
MVVAALALGGCGGSSKTDLSNLSATKLLAKSKAALGGKEDVQISGSGSDSGNSVGIDLSYVGDDASGTVKLGNAEISLLTVGGGAWFKASDEFWKSQFSAKQATAVIAVVNGRWIKVDPTDASFKDMFSLAHRSGLDTGLLDPNGSVTKDKAKTIAGVPCLALKSSSGILYVDKANARPMEIDNATGNASKLTFSYKNEAAPTAPAAKDVLDYSELAGATQ